MEYFIFMYVFLFILDQKFRSENSHQEKTDDHILIDLGPSKSDASDGCNKILSFRKRENAITATCTPVD